MLPIKSQEEFAEDTSIKVMIFQSLWFLSGFPWQMVAANKEATEPRVHIG
jgi:hypothetical protein